MKIFLFISAVLFTGVFFTDLNIFNSWIVQRPKLAGALTVIYPWLLFTMFIIFCFKMVGWARKRRSSAVVFGALVQMLLPDPYAERTLKQVQEEKQIVKKQKESDDEPK